MIIQCNDHLVALLENGDVYCWGFIREENGRSDPNKVLIANEVKALAKFWSWIDVPILLMKDGRVLISLYLQEKFIDITAYVYETLESNQDCLVYGFYVSDYAIMVTTQYRAAIIMPRICGLGSYPDIHLSLSGCDTAKISFDSEIDYASFGYGHGYFLTRDNQLHNINVCSFASDRPDSGNCWRINYGGFNRIEAVDIDNPRDIIQIISFRCFSLFLLNNGQVYRQCYINFPHDIKISSCHSEPARPINFGEPSIFVTKMIASDELIFFLTTTGSVYYQQAIRPRLGDDNEEQYRPKLIRFLANLDIENVIIMKHTVIAKASSGYYSFDIQSLFDNIRLGFYVLPNLKHLSIVDAHYLSINGDTYFLTNLGSLYYQNSHGFDRYKPIEFFEENPIEIDANKTERVMQIRSALSSLAKAN